MAEKIHDKGYKRLFSNQHFFRELIESFVTEDWVKDIDFTDCQKIDKSFVSAHYKETESDLIYKVKFKDKDAYIYLLLEFQSTVVWHMALRVLNYVSNFYMDYVESNDKVRKLPPIFPLVLYSGDKKWTATNDFRNLLEQPDLLQQYTPQIHYFKIAENEYSSDSLLKMNNLVSMLFLAENHHNIEVISQHLYELFDEEDKQAISILLNWFKQLTLRGKKSLDDYQLLEHIYHSKNEVKAMFDIELEPYAQRHFVEGQAKGEVIGEKRGEKKGEKIGERRGERKGELKGELNSLIIVLETRFGELTLEQKKKISTISKRKLSRLLTKSVSVESLSIFFNDINYEAKNK